MKPLLVLALAVSAGCAASFRTVGMEDSQTEIVRALAASQTASIKALTDALTAAQRLACEVR